LSQTGDKNKQNVFKKTFFGKFFQKIISDKHAAAGFVLTNLARLKKGG